MANQITAPRFIVKNQPINISTTTNGIMKLQLGTNLDPTAHYEGVIYPKPGVNNVGLDIQPYIFNAVKFQEFDILGGNQNLTGWDEMIYIKMLNNLNGVVYNQDESTTAPVLLNRNHTEYEWSQMLLQKPYGRFEKFLKSAPANRQWNKATSTINFWDDPITSKFLKTYNSDTDVDRLNYNLVLGNAPIFLGMNNLTTANRIFTISTNWYTVNFKTKVQLSTLNQSLSVGGFYYFKLDNTLYKNYSFGIKYPYASLIERFVYFKRVDPSCFKDEPYQLYWINNSGGIDWIVMSGKSIKTRSTSKKQYRRETTNFTGTAFTGTHTDHNLKHYNVQTTTKYELNSDWLKSEDYDQLSDIIESDSVWLYNPKDESIKAVTILDNDFVHKNFRNDKLFNFSITLEEQHKLKIY